MQDILPNEQIFWPIFGMKDIFEDFFRTKRTLFIQQREKEELCFLKKAFSPLFLFPFVTAMFCS